MEWANHCLREATRPHDVHDVEVLYALLHQLGLVYRNRLGDAARAIECFRATRAQTGYDEIEAPFELLSSVEISTSARFSRGACSIATARRRADGKSYTRFSCAATIDNAWYASMSW